jgi:hypothetical protein
MFCVVQILTTAGKPYRCEVVGGFASYEEAIEYVSAGGYVSQLLRADARSFIEVNGDWWFVVEEAHYAEAR